MPWGPAIDGTSVGLLDMPLNLLTKGTLCNLSSDVWSGVVWSGLALSGIVV